jgi:SPP1 gp7 family putative phage head morphogenesis protein
MDQKKSKEYWKKRAERQEKKVHKEGDKLLKELDKNLINARKEIQKSINDLVVRYMDLTELSYADAMKNLTSSEFREWRMTLEEYMAEIEKFKGIDEEIANKLKLELETLAMKSRISRLDTLKAQIDMELNKKAYAEQEALKETLETVYNDSYRDIRLDFGVESSVAYLDKDTLSDLINYPWSGTGFSNRIWENRAALGRVLKEEIIQSFIQGISVKDLSDKIMGRMNSDRKNTERLVRTELNYALNQATKKGYEDSEVEEYEYLAEIDSRTSPQCRELNGKVFKLEDVKVGINYPPMHPHCRSTTIPVIEYEKLKEPEKNDIIELDSSSNNPVIRRCIEKQIEYIGIEKYSTIPSEEIIISELGGGDKTRGSCSSLAFAYAGNKNGYKVLDFRGGNSQAIFASNKTILEITELEGIKSWVIKEKNDFTAIKKLIANIEEKKEYYLAIGRHAAIIRKIEKGYEYLELQSAKYNGFKTFDMNVLKNRFGCQKSYRRAGMTLAPPSMLIDIDTLKDNKEFNQMLGFINTAKEKQLKGVEGHEK